MTLIGLLSSTVSKSAKKLVGASKASFEQEKERCGLLVTDELEKALAECKAKVEKISKDCRAKNRKFRDIEFDLQGDRDRCLHGLDNSILFLPAGVQRVTEIFEKPKFFVNGADSNDIVQGQIGDCWFVSALATMAVCPGLIESFCVARDELVGVYGFVFFRDASWVVIIIDDLLFVSVPKFDELSYAEKALYHNDSELYNKTARKGGKSLYFAKSGTDGETWVPLIEKAYAKLHGDYASMSGGEESEAIEDLTGGVSTLFNTNDILDVDKFWEEELLLANQDRLFSCAFNSLDGSRSGDSDIRVKGLIGSHAYSILRAVECKGKRFVIIRNPWGNSEWTGPWSDGSKEWTREWLQALPDIGHTFGDDGQFIMEYKDFLANWEEVDRTRLFDSSWRTSSQWLQVTARPLPSAWTYGDVSFTFTLPTPSFTIVVLSELDDRYFHGLGGSATWIFDFVIFKKGEKEVLSSSAPNRIWSRSVNAELDLEAGEYVVHVRLDRTITPDVPNPDGTPDPPVDSRKLSRVLTEKIKGQSKASNFKLKSKASNLPVPLETLAGQDITEMEKKAKEAELAMQKAEEALEPASVTVTTDETTVTTVEVALGVTDGEDAPKIITSEETTETTTGTVAEASKSETVTETAAITTTEAASETATETTTGEEKEASAAPDSSSPALANGEENAVVSSAAVPSASEAPAPNDNETDIELDEDNTLFLGIRIYTHKDSPVSISGQLRHEMNISFEGLAAAAL